MSLRYLSLTKLPGRVTRLLRLIKTFHRGQLHALGLPRSTGATAPEPSLEPNNAFRDYFNSVESGPGIWKWRHYFEIYQQHFGKFIGRPEVNILEIGVYSGGSLGMWREVFGPGCTVFGVDIEPACREYERDNVHILIGDQGDRRFWREIRDELPPLDIVIDDGGHLPEQQIITLEETLPLLRPGGVYLCEDIQHPFNPFHFYLAGFASALNVSEPCYRPPEGPIVPANSLQDVVRSITLHPYVAVIETREQPVGQFESPKHGTQWQPFLKERPMKSTPLP